MPSPLASSLESISGYRPVYPPGDPQADKNPIVYSHLHMNAAGKRYFVLSRISDYGLDYSQRANKIAHHVVLEPQELASGGPAALLEQSGFMETTWDGKPRVLPSGRSIPSNDRLPAICRTWQRLTGDAGWAGVLAESLLADPDQQAYLIFQPGMNVLALMTEAIALLPREHRWDASFSTYFTSLPPGVNCNWRCVLAGSAEANQSRRFVRALRIDLTQPIGNAAGGNLVELARTGKLPSRSVSAAPLTMAPERQAPPSRPSPISLSQTSRDALPPLATEDEFKTLPPEPGHSRQGPPLPPSRAKDRARKASSKKDWLVWTAGLIIILASIAAATYFIVTHGETDLQVADADETDGRVATVPPGVINDPNTTTDVSESTTPKESTSSFSKPNPSEKEIAKPPVSVDKPSSPKTTEVDGSSLSPPMPTKENAVPKNDTPDMPTQALENSTYRGANAMRPARTIRAPNKPYYFHLPDVNGDSQAIALKLPSDFSINNESTFDFVLPNVPQNGQDAWPKGKPSKDGIDIYEHKTVNKTALGKFYRTDDELFFHWARFSPSVAIQATLLRFCAIRIKSGEDVLFVVLHESSANASLLVVADELLEKQLMQARKRKPLSESRKSWTIMPRLSSKSNPITPADRGSFPLEHFLKLSLVSLTLKSAKGESLHFEPVHGKPPGDPKDKLRHFANELDLESKDKDLVNPLIVHEGNGLIEIGVNHVACANIQSKLEDQFDKLLHTIPTPDDRSDKENDKKPTEAFQKFSETLRVYSREISGGFPPALKRLNTTPWRYHDSQDAFDNLLKSAKDLRDASQKLKLLEGSDDLYIADAEISYGMAWDNQKPIPVLLRYQSPQKKTN